MSAPTPQRVLFLSVRNSGRSQIAEALVNHFLGEEWRAYSAGSAPAGAVHPLALKVLMEWGIDTTPLHPKALSAFAGQPFDLIIALSDEPEPVPVWPGPEPVRRVWLPAASRTPGSVGERLDAFRQARNVIWYAVREHLHTAPGVPAAMTAR